MTQPGLSPVLTASTPDELLKALKDLKNGIIGNTWKKVETAENESVLRVLLSLLGSRSIDEHQAELINETAVILGALSNVGPLTIRPLLALSTPAVLFSLIRYLAFPKTSLSRSNLSRLLPSLLKALRNLLVTTADLVWGHMWGVGAEKKVVGTGLVGLAGGVESSGGKGKAVAGKAQNWREDAMRALSLSFEQANLSCLMSLIQMNHETSIILPIYQLLARLVALPSHREALVRWNQRWTPVQSPTSSTFSPINTGARTPENPYIINHLLTTLTIQANGTTRLRKFNSKLIDSSLDLLAAIVKGQGKLAMNVRLWSMSGAEMEVDGTGEMVDWMVELTNAGPISVRIAAANCLTNIIKADSPALPSKQLKWTVLILELLKDVGNLLKTEGAEDRVRISFIIAALVSDNPELQRSAFEKGLPRLLCSHAHDIERELEKGLISSDLATRSREAILLTIASLCFACESTRSQLAEASPPFLPYVHQSLSHSSYGVRAAACQLTRALSRTISILRTNLVDSGIGKEVIETLKREVTTRKEREAATSNTGEYDLGDRAYTVEVAATATICNLIADYSPLRDLIITDGSLQVICDLTRSTHEPLALNALWALKNLTFRALETTKMGVMTMFGWDNLNALVVPPTPTCMRIQGLEIVQNLIADASPIDIGKYLDLLGENNFLHTLSQAAQEDESEELRIPALYVMSNLALGNERVRTNMSSRVEILEVLSISLNAKSDQVKIPGIRTIRHLVEANAKTHKPRQAMLDLLYPYQLRTRLKELAEGSPNLEVCKGAVALLDVMKRGREGGSIAGAVVEGGTSVPR